MAGVLPLETGMLPLSSLSAKSSQKKLDKLPMEAGISPMKLFKLSDRKTNFCRDPIEGGIRPINPHPTTIKLDKFIRFPIDEGICPLISLLYERSKICNADNFSISDASSSLKFMLANVMETTRSSVQLIPSQLLPQGSAPYQFGGKLSRPSIRPLRATKSSVYVEATTPRN